MGHLVKRPEIVARALGLALLMGLTANCFGPSKVSQADLVREDAHQLRMPGAVELAHVGNDRRMTIDGEQEPFDGYIFGTDASADEVVAFYSRELIRLGWVSDKYQVFHATTEFKAWGWCKRGMRLRLATDRPGTIAPSVYGGRAFATVFDARLIGRDPEVPCPQT